jgi:hypothetical protein
MKKLFILSFLTVLTFLAQAQSCETFDDAELTAKIMKDVTFLADDQLEGRAPGTKGALIARDYIASRFTEAGLAPMGDEGTFFQAFKVPEPVIFDAEQTQLTVNGRTLELINQFYPTQYASNTKASGYTVNVGFGITAPELNHDDYKKISDLNGKIAVIDISAPDGIHPHSAYLKYHDLGNRIELAKEKGAIGVILINPGKQANDLSASFKKIRSQEIPVVFIKDPNIVKQFKKSVPAEISVWQTEVFADSYNVIGFKNNGKGSTVVIGAHYDHLGWGHEGSLSSTKEIHNGADDNASGTAGLISLAEFLARRQDFNHHNYLFIAFCAEERGLMGSNYYVNHPTQPLNRTAFMINMDMIGRLREGNLQVSGTGTASEWETIFSSLTCENIVFKLDPSGVGPSDHTSFYNNNIPVLHFFTGSHEDYHKPGDDVEKVNFQGVERVTSIIKFIISQTSSNEFLNFKETKNDNSKNTPRFSVTLGIMPDYMYEDGGVKIDGVSPDKPAAKAGLQKGDILIKLGDFKITDMQSYMTALSAFRKGDKTTVIYTRDGKRHETKIQF